jgi:hypothetical protein
MTESWLQCLARFLKKLMLLSHCNGNYIHENQVGEVLSYQYEPEVGENKQYFNFGIGNS